MYVWGTIYFTKRQRNRIFEPNNGLKHINWKALTQIQADNRRWLENILNVMGDTDEDADDKSAILQQIMHGWIEFIFADSKSQPVRKKSRQRFVHANAITTLLL